MGVCVFDAFFSSIDCCLFVSLCFFSFGVVACAVLLSVRLQRCCYVFAVAWFEELNCFLHFCFL